MRFQSTFEQLEQSFFEGIPGVILFDSGRSGPTLGITIGTHGDELSGLALAEFLLTDDWLAQCLQAGRVFLVLNNIEATRAGKRCTELNFNRLPTDALTREDERYEVCRLKELYPIYEQFDVAIDLHNTSLESDPMLIRAGLFDPSLVRGFDVEVMISHIDEHQIGVPGFVFHGGLDREIPTFELECGSSQNPDSYKRAIECVQVLLTNLKMIAGELASESKAMRHYEIVDSIYFPNKSYELLRVFPMFAEIKKGELIATGNGAPILAPCDGHLLLGPKTKKPRSIDEEVFFVSAPFSLL